MSIAGRKKVELAQKLASLEHEFRYWHDQSEARQLLEKNHTQIRRITNRLEGYREEIGGRLEKADGAALLALCRELEINILTVHRLWGFFRDKLALRSVPPFQEYLFLADELAWACYEAAQRRVLATHVPAEEVKEPPLVFFSDSSSPFTSSRNSAYELEPVEDEELPPDEGRDDLKSLPVPVIGIPWFQIRHLPDALVIGHEVGHDVEDDFRLTERLSIVLDSAMEKAKLRDDHRDAWQGWLGEVFADVYGSLATGPAFVGTLIDFLATDPRQVAGEHLSPPDWGDYLPAHLRVLFNLEILIHQGFEKEARRLRDEWLETYPAHQMKEFEADLPIVARALLDGPYPELGNVSLAEVLAFTPAQHDEAARLAADLLNKIKLRSDDARLLLAAARLAYEKDPAKFAAVGPHQRIAKSMANKVGVRAEKVRTGPTLAVLDAYDRAAGAKLYRRSAAPPIPPDVPGAG
jgi:hypothetical protein